MRQAPSFEDFSVGDEFNGVPCVTLTEGYVAIHQALFCDRLPLVLDHELARRTTAHGRQYRRHWYAMLPLGRVRCRRSG
ncbi:MAG: hypothetical protein U5O39_17640 [Gammaproteobacteria bacterium]|nr:hypothetical protein [Gammaproteobacteria bacterium]